MFRGSGIGGLQLRNKNLTFREIGIWKSWNFQIWSEFGPRSENLEISRGLTFSPEIEIARELKGRLKFRFLKSNFPRIRVERLQFRKIEISAEIEIPRNWNLRKLREAEVEISQNWNDERWRSENCRFGKKEIRVSREIEILNFEIIPAVRWTMSNLFVLSVLSIKS